MNNFGLTFSCIYILFIGEEETHQNLCSCKCRTTV